MGRYPTGDFPDMDSPSAERERGRENTKGKGEEDEEKKKRAPEKWGGKDEGRRGEGRRRPPDIKERRETRIGSVNIETQRI